MPSKTDTYHNNYRFFDDPKINSSGFVTFRYPSDGQYYFRFNDINNKPVLFSEGYQTAINCEIGIQCVLKNIAKRKQYKIAGEPGNRFIKLHAGDNREIARSAFFKDDSEISQVIAVSYTHLTLPTKA